MARSPEHQKRLGAVLEGDFYVKLRKSDAPKAGDTIQTQSRVYENPSTLKRDITDDEKYVKSMEIQNKNGYYNYPQEWIDSHDPKNKVVCECKLVVVKVLDATTLEEYKPEVGGQEYVPEVSTADLLPQ